MGLTAAGLVVAGLVGSAWAADAVMGGGRLVRAAQLRASSGQTAFSSVAMSGGVVVAGAPESAAGSNQSQGAAYVFIRPKGGWSSETEDAKLVASDGAGGDYFGSSVAISGDTVVAGSSGPAICTLAGCPNQLPSKVLRVFIKPRGGWSGTLAERGTLTVGAAGFGGFGGAAISGDTIVAQPLPQVWNGAEQQKLYVFTRPAAGWSGTVHPSATLIPSGGVLLGQQSGPTVAISGRDIFASGTTTAGKGAVFVFHRPGRGWTGRIREQARLTASSSSYLWPLAMSGPTVAAGTSGPNGTVKSDVFSKPKRGWSGVVRPTATLRPTPLPYGGETDPYTGSIAVSGSMIATLVLGPTSSSCFPTNVCSETLYTFSRPRRGWRGTIAAHPNASAVPPPFNAYPLAIVGDTVATGGSGGTIDIFTHTLRRALVRR